MRDTESTTAATPVGHDAVPSEPTRDTFAARLRRRYHAGIARCIAQNVVKPGATVLLVDPRHDTYITALDSRAVAVVANAPEARTRLGAAFPEVRVLGGSLADAARGSSIQMVQLPGDEPDWNTAALDAVAWRLMVLDMQNRRQARPLPQLLAAEHLRILDQFAGFYVQGLNDAMKSNAIEDTWLGGLDLDD